MELYFSGKVPWSLHCKFRDAAGLCVEALLMVVLVGVVLLLVSLILAALGTFKLERPTSL
ncbi:MAG: hypothetical protein ABWK05_06140 [Pyrobaculum sp.]